VIKAISKKILIGDYSKNGNLEIRLKKKQFARRESSPQVNTYQMNVIKEEEKSSQNIKFIPSKIKNLAFGKLINQLRE
jgi:hypothetical protein